MADLRARTEYEAWLLEAVYDITDQRIAVEDVERTYLPTFRGPPAQTIYGVGNINIGDWRRASSRRARPWSLLQGSSYSICFLNGSERERAHIEPQVRAKIAALKGGGPVS